MIVNFLHNNGRQPEDFLEALEWRILVKITFFSFFAILIYMSYDWMHSGIQKAIPSSSALFLYGGSIYLLLRYKRKALVKHLVLSLYVMSVTAGFFLMGGFSNIVLLDFMNILLLITILSQRRVRLVYYALISIVLVVGAWCSLVAPHWIQNNRIGDPIYLVGLHVMLRFVLIVVNSFTIRREFVKENKVTRELNSQLIAANGAVEDQKAALEKINAQLDELVQNRTEKIKKLNLKLIDYAYFNAHKVRGPVARILGLINLLNFEDIDEQERIVYLNKLRDCVEDLDLVIREINDTLEEKSPMEVVY